ncbi:hypothetical protein Taro_001351 [Colocasia esculenta]|uniref:Uncharacterized protein n=1 Tax=Colocasia esculenta TaxID=4460 RepID=A0A843THX0_COLES|nr:hypothetical protein [Colocasia esculenta]
MGKSQIFIRAVIGTTRESPIRNRHFEPVDTMWSRTADAIAYGHPFAQTGITFRSVIEITYKTPIRNRYSDALVAPLSPQAIRLRFRVEKPSFRTRKLQLRPMITLFQRFSRSNASLDHVNPGRGSHTESTCHGDWKLC